MGSILEGSGAIWGVSWALLGASWPSWGRSKSSFFLTLVQDGLQEAFWIDFGSILEGFGRDLGGVWGDLGRLLGALGRFLAVVGAFKIEPFFQHWSKMVSKRPFGSIWGRFGVDLGVVLGGFGEGLGKFLE